MSEKGHAKNIANFLLLVEFVVSFGAVYNPSNPLITLASLNATKAAAEALLGKLNIKFAALTNAINAREILYTNLSALTTRIVNAVKASGASDQFIEDVKTLARKIQGRRKTAAAVDDPNTTEDESKKAHSASQMSYTNRAENFSTLTALVKSEPIYAPNEAELKTSALEGHYDGLKASNEAVDTAYVGASGVRVERDDFLYTDESGLVEQALLVKAYVKSLFGANSPEYKQIKGIEFKRYPA